MPIVDIPNLNNAAALADSDLFVVTQGTTEALKATLGGLETLVNADRIAGIGVFASIGSPASYTSKLWLVTDVGINASIWSSNGSVWRPIHAVVLGRSAVASSTLTGSTAETALATVTVPANVMGLDGSLVVSTLWSNNNSGNAKTVRIRYTTIGGTIYGQMANTTTLSMRHIDNRISNRNATNSQVGYFAGNTFSTATAPITSAVDTTASTTLVISGQLANAGDNMALEQYKVVLEP
jgi:hypothetical protein